ncbi:MAG: BlaI/MecI/CopY family transcriptional regulator [Melioribacteraceae bacterium]|nr:BlaI/MecI/CopY family transcriptional regulator [Melioribacteraceae bacterium]
MTKKLKPTDSELEILQVLWKFGPSTVRFVNDKLSVLKEVGYTTTLKLMQIMSEKKLLEREKDGRSHVYKAVIEENSTKNVLLDKVLETAFQGSASGLMMQLLGNKKTSQDELDKIKELIKNFEEKKQ